MKRGSSLHFLAVLVVICALCHPGTLLAGTLTVNVANRGGTLKKAGLGSLFGATSLGSGTSKAYLSDSLLFVAQSQGRTGENGSNAYSTEAVAPVIRGTGVKMMCRFGDLCYGWPYEWPGYNTWVSRVTSAANSIKSNYPDVVYGIAWFNEPDTQLTGTDFMTDPLVGGGTTHDGRINWLWTQTYRLIRSIAPNVKIMGPNYFDYRPQWFSAHQTRMQAFLANAVATSTVPDSIGWHSLVEGNPADVTNALVNYYRPLETSLKVPGAPLPVSIEEFGINNAAFEGVPGQMIRYWAEFERAGISFACMGIYENGGSVGNTLRYNWDANPLPNAGSWAMNWYRAMQGVYVPTTRSTFDGVAAWDSTAGELSVVFGGAAENSAVKFTSLSALGLGADVRVRLERAEWTTNSNVANPSVNQGGDPLTESLCIFDRAFTVASDGSLTVPVRLENIYDGYRLVVSAVAAAGSYPTKYEAESATTNHVAIYTGSGAAYQASGRAYVGGIDYADSFVCFRTTVPADGLYRLRARYAAGLGDATHNVFVNGASQGTVNYPGTSGWSTVEMRTASRLVALKRGDNDLLFTKGTGYAELDCIDLRPDTHRYQAKLATTNAVILGFYANLWMVPDYVGGINDTTAYVEFSVEAPVAGSYQLEIAFANGTTSSAIDAISVNGVTTGVVSLSPSGGWLSAGAGPNVTRKKVVTTQNLNAGWNTVRLQKSAGFAELDYLTVYPSAILTPVAPKLGLSLSGTTATLSWAAVSKGYVLQRNTNLSSAGWTTVTDAGTQTGSVEQVTQTQVGPSGFFRLYPSATAANN